MAHAVENPDTITACVAESFGERKWLRFGCLVRRRYHAELAGVSIGIGRNVVETQLTWQV
jgi:hypothetical protein